MQEIQYIGETLWIGKLGHLAVIIGFIFTLLAAFSFYKAQTKGDLQWKNLGRASLITHSFAVFIVMALLFHIMIGRFYEYHYAFKNVNDDLPFKYIFSAFWADQEGSFLLWMFWHAILGLFILFQRGKWEASVLAVLSFVQFFMFSMLMGVYVGFGENAIKIGSDPFLLLREAMSAPIFSNADYLSLIEGNGLNPLLQNYWNTIHPPVTFLGFASLTIPFAFAIAGLWTKQHKEFLKYVLSWASFAGAILGTGILMGGAWAYEALSFGGYWAWDPVENMSLVPWLFIVAGLHINLIARKTNKSIKTVYIFYIVAFILITYSTFLTRSGVLGETSVHAFTTMGLEVQMLIMILCFITLSVFLLVLRRGEFKADKTDDNLSSREFWMFVGALVLAFSAIMITLSTSLPVYNKIRAFFQPSFIGSVIDDPVDYYNKYQLWVAVFIGLLSGVSQYLRYQEKRFSIYRKKVFISIGIASVGALIFATLFGSWMDMHAWQYWTLLFTSFFTVAANLDYMIRLAKLNPRAVSSSISHLGFGIMVVGTLASGLNKFHISSNPFAQRGLLSEDRLGKNIMLFKNMPMFMKGFKVTYLDDHFEGNNRIYDIKFEELDEKGMTKDSFVLHPTALYNNTITKVAAFNPSTLHTWSKDIFTYIASIPQVEADVEIARQKEDSLSYINYTLSNETTVLKDTVIVGDSMVVRSYEVDFIELLDLPTHPDYVPQEGDLSLTPLIAIKDTYYDSTYTAEPSVVLRGNAVYSFNVHLQDISLKIKVLEEGLKYAFISEDDLEYQTFDFGIGETINVEGHQVQFIGFTPNPESPEYVPQEGDEALWANFIIDGEYGVKPIVCIRGNNFLTLKAKDAVTKLHIKPIRINLDNGAAEAKLITSIAQEKKSIEAYDIPIGIAHAPRTDFVVLESIVFPGINFFWVGAIVMLVGLFIGIWNHRNKRLVA